MTLYDLTAHATIQSNIEIIVFSEEGIEMERRFFRDQDDFSTYYEDCQDIEDFTVTYIYSNKSVDGTPWLIIEITKQ